MNSLMLMGCYRGSLSMSILETSEGVHGLYTCLKYGVDLASFEKVG